MLMLPFYLVSLWGSFCLMHHKDQCYSYSAVCFHITAVIYVVMVIVRYGDTTEHEGEPERTQTRA